MTAFSVLRNLTSIALTASCAIGVSSARAQTYSLMDLGMLPGQKISTPAALNVQAQVAGTSGQSAFRYTCNAEPPMEDLGSNPPNSISHGFGINYSGVVVGDSTFGQDATCHAAVFGYGSPTDLGVLYNVDFFSRANGINATGAVVGFSGPKVTGEDARAFIVWNSSRLTGMVDLGTLGGDFAQAWAINDYGYVTGNSQTPGNGIIAYKPTHAFIWDETNGMLDLGTLDGDFSYGTSINYNNHVAGYSTINNVDNRVHAFLHDGTQMLDLGSLGGASFESDRSVALGVNANDQVVGYSYLPADGSANPVARQVAFVYMKGLMFDLNTLIMTTSDQYRLDSATAINDKGQIVAIAYDNVTAEFHAVLLTPIPSGIPGRPAKP